jgi:mono/diheme cytochrome c family protein
MGMKRIGRWLLWIGVILVAAGALAAVAAHMLSDRKAQRKIDVRVEPVAYVDGAEAIARGKYLFDSRGCAECHGANGAGRFVVDDGSLRIKSPNITRGAGGVVASYKESDWVRAIRHGVKPGGQPIRVMPCEDYNRMTNIDLAALVAYVRQLPAADGGPAEFSLPLMLKALYVVGVIPDAPERIDHSLPPAAPVAESVSVEHGAYVANMCIGCHGPKLTGGPVPGGPPNWPPAADLTRQTGVWAIYKSAVEFKGMMRSGKSPDGRTIQVMPFPSFRQMNDTDLDALYLYLRTPR